MPPTNECEKKSLVDEILKCLPLADKTAVWGTLGTIRPHVNFVVEKDVHSLLEAITGEGIKYGTVIDLLTNRNNEQRLRIVKGLQAISKEDLLKILEAPVTGETDHNVFVSLLSPEAQYAAHEIKEALKGPEADTLIEILSTQADQQLQEILDIYKHDFKSDLEKDITAETSGCFKDLLVSLIKENREKYTGIIDYVLIEQDTKALLDAAGDGETSRLDESEWIRILTQRSPEHLNRVFGWYHKLTGLQIEDAMKKYFQDKAQEAILTLASILRNTPLHFAMKLYQTVKGPGTSQRALARIMISRSEIDLLGIRAEFKKQYGISLYSFIQVETQGNYQTILLGLCKAEDL